MLDPIEVIIEADHAFKKRKPDAKTGKKRIGCDVCGRGKLSPQHLGAPPSMNDGGSGMDRMAYQALKQAWQETFAMALDVSGLERGLESVSVEAQIGFSTLTKRDEGNMRWMIEKALGDALKAGGYVEDDCFYPVRRYTFGGLEGVHVPGRSFTRLLLFPSMDAPSAVGSPALALPVYPMEEATR